MEQLLDKNHKNGINRSMVESELPPLKHSSHDGGSDTFRKENFREAPVNCQLQNFDEDFDNCSTYSQILDKIDVAEHKRPRQPRELYEGRRGARKKFFFILQTVYPLIQGMIFIWIVFGFLVGLQFKQ